MRGILNWAAQYPHTFPILCSWYRMPDLADAPTHITASFKRADKSGRISSLNTTIEILNIVKDTVEIIPAKGIFGSVVSILAVIRVSTPAVPQSFLCSQAIEIRIKQSTTSIW